jgi:type IV pilus assembly protein PilY1
MDGSIIKQFGTVGSPITGMDYAIPSNVLVVDEDDNGFLDKVYVGDLGGQMWRIGKFADSIGDPLAFPSSNEDISTWTAQIFFKTDSSNSRKFFYPPSVTLELGYDMVFMGTGDREDACNATPATSDMIAAAKDTHSLTTIVGETDMVDVTDPTATLPDLTTDLGWYIRLVDDSGSAVGEKVLAEGVVFYKAFYITTFTPNEDPCAPGGDGKLYALSHLTGEAVLDFDNDGNNDRSVTIGGGIPSKPVTLITKTGTRLLVSVGSANPNAASPTTGAGVMNITPLLPPINFFYKFWKEVF